jgi:carbonic anhydrase
MPRLAVLVAAAAATAVLSGGGGIGGTGVLAATPYSYVRGSDQGPEYWQGLAQNYGTCSTGSAQSPINILSGDIDPSLRGIGFEYRKVAATMVNEGSTMLWKAGNGSMIMYDGREYELKYVRFHTPAEHRMRRLSLPMEAQLFHETSAAQLAADAAALKAGVKTAGAGRPDLGKVHTVAIAALFVEGQENQALLPLLEHLPGKRGGSRLVDALVSPDALLPVSRRYYTYEGSHTVPPCAEGVTWVVLSSLVQAAPAQIQMLSDLAEGERGDRPAQPLNGRVVTRYAGSRHEVAKPLPKGPPPPGPPGPRGTRGRQGPPGAHGVKGPGGPLGHRGATGAAGKDGRPGERGPDGVRGPLGNRGAKGARGPTGDKGVRGPAGNDGKDGADAGAAATVRGPAGPKGYPGDSLPGGVGPRGSRGRRGVAGPKGDVGEAGPRGAPGDARSGPAGAVGKQGPRGHQGRRGAKGPNGANGDTGAPGPRGSRGPVGHRGPFGAEGPKAPEWASANEFAQSLAESTCASLASRSKAISVYAVKRPVPAKGKKGISCTTLCKNVETACFGALHVYDDFRKDYGLSVYRYKTCDEGNFCCCAK